MSRKRNKQAQSGSPADRQSEFGASRQRTSNDVSPHRSLLLGWLTALWIARWWLPTEGSVEGLTLWLIPMVLLTGVVRGVLSWVRGASADGFDAVDLALAWLVGAQSVSAALVVFGVGDARAAINVAWEWIGTAALTWMFRRELRGSLAVREVSLGIALAAGVLAGYGLWQHFVWYPQLIRDYDLLVDKERRLAAELKESSSASSKSAAARQLDELQIELARMQIPSEAGARQLWEQRLKASREPLGLFALANSLAGLLAVALFVQLGLLLSQWSDWRWRGMLIGVIAVTGYCLLLTKSRTALVGTAAGSMWWLGRWAMWRGDSRVATNSTNRPEGADEHKSVRSRGVQIVAISIVVVVVGLTIAFASGGLDRAVLSEAPKSLRYRLEYWTATLATIREQPWFGTGPGNFRDRYLKHKLPASSEEIADPHNLVLDVWANAGTVGLIGLVASIALMFTAWRRPIADSGQRDLSVDAAAGRPQGSATGAEWQDQRDESRLWTSPAALGTGVSFVVVALGLELFGFGTDERIWWLGIAWWLLWLLTWGGFQLTGQPHRSGVSSSEIPPLSTGLSFEAGFLALLIHLLGAGGIAMPAIVQFLWLVWILRTAWSNDPFAEKSSSNAASIGVGGNRFQGHLSWPMQIGFLTILFAGCCVTAAQPETLCRAHLALGDAAAMRSDRQQSAREEYLLAAAADGWSLEPPQRLAELSFRDWSGRFNESDFDAAVRWQEEVIARRPFAAQSWRRLGDFWFARHQHSRQISHAESATAAYQRAAANYPHHAQLQADWALASIAAGDAASGKVAAEHALQQDRLNRSLGHSDKFLREELRRRLESIVENKSSTSPMDNPN